jgi:alcohol dehydrogenase
MVVSNGEALKRAGGADVILVTSNSYNAASEVIKGLRPDGRLVLMGVSDEPLLVTAEIIVTVVALLVLHKTAQNIFMKH